MAKTKYKQIIYLVLTLIWMLSVFLFSNQNGEESQSTSSSITKIIIEIITKNQNIEEAEKLELIQSTDYYIRKLAHYSIYTLGGVLIYNYINTLETTRKKAILISILIGITYAISDELHQHFTAGRSAKIFDVIIDSFGIITGVTLINIVGKIKKALT